MEQFMPELRDPWKSRLIEVFQWVNKNNEGIRIPLPCPNSTYHLYFSGGQDGNIVIIIETSNECDCYQYTYRMPMSVLFSDDYQEDFNDGNCRINLEKLVS